MPREVAMYANKNGELKTLTEWAKEFSISRDTMYHRVVNMGMTVDEAAEFIPDKNIAKITDPISGETHSVHEWASILNIPYNTLRRRIKFGYTDEEVLHSKSNEVYKVKSKRNRVYKSMDLTGRKFGMLTVIKRCDKKREGEKEWRWVCECDCPDHNIVEVIQHNLLNGHCTNCGCSNRNTIKNLVGKKFGYLTVIERDYNKSDDGSSLWKCRCQCGRELSVSAIKLRSSKYSLSCGICNSLEGIDQDTIDDLYTVYMDMHSRCFNKKDVYYHRYGGRGIVVCDEWKRDYDTDVHVTKQIGFANFCKWAVTYGYRKGLTIDRRDNDGIYSPENCHWITMKDQQNNRSDNFNITYNGETKTAAQWSEGLDISSSSLRKRINNGMSPKEAIETPHRRKIATSSSGEAHSLVEWSEISGIDNRTLYGRIIDLGWDVDKALLTKATNPEIYNHVSPASVYAVQHPGYIDPPIPPAMYYVDILGRYYTPEEWDAHQAITFDD